MNTISDYTIYCTESQTRKALELGAPIVKVDTRDKHMIYYECLCYPRTEADYPYAIPTTEQMIGWLEEQRFGIDIVSGNSGYEWSIWVRKDNTESFLFIAENDSFLDTRKEATLEAIDSALTYLGKIK